MENFARVGIGRNLVNAVFPVNLSANAVQGRAACLLNRVAPQYRVVKGVGEIVCSGVFDTTPTNPWVMCVSVLEYILGNATCLRFGCSSAGQQAS